MLTGEQITKARELLGWSVVDLGHWSGVDRLVILSFELGRSGLEEPDIAKIKDALRKSRVEFSDEGAVRLAQQGRG